MSEIVKKFKLKRTGRNTMVFTRGQIYPVYRSEMDKYTHWSFYIVDDSGERKYFNTINGQIDASTACLKTENWEIIRTSKEEKTMTKDFTGLKVGDKITRDNDNWSWWIKGKEYEVHENITGRYINCEFYIVDEDNDRRWFSVDDDGKLTHADVQASFSWNKPEEPETPPHTITITGHDWVDLEKNLRDAYRKVKLLSKASDKFDESTAELAQRVLEYKKIGGQ